jgi:hypothetical protein
MFLLPGAAAGLGELRPIVTPGLPAVLPEGEPIGAAGAFSCHW